MLVQQPGDVYDPEAEVETLRYWLGVDRFDRRRLNQELRQDALERAAGQERAPRCCGVRVDVLEEVLPL